jgi:hypothetical protein
MRAAGVVVGALGVVGLGVAGGFALAAASKNNDSKGHCQITNPNVCDTTGVSLRNDALNAGNAATIALAVGGAALASGVVLWLAAPSGSSRVRVSMAPTLGGAVLQGAW